MTEETQKVMFSNNKDDWETPKDFYDRLDQIYHFTLDPCASKENHKCEKYYTEEDDGLSKSWKNETCFINPPYSDMKEWIKKAYEESKQKNTVCVCLIASRTDTAAWHEYCMKAYRIIFVQGRLKFGNSKNTAPFPSAVVIFKETSNPYMHSPLFSTMRNKEKKVK